jgi:hypothetical protein
VIICGGIPQTVFHSQDHSDRPQFLHLSLYAKEIPHFPLQNNPEAQLKLCLFQISTHQSIFMVPTWHKISESKKADNVGHSFFRDSQFKSNIFLFYSTIFSKHFFNAFLMRLVCCSHWPPQSCFVPQTCFPHSFLLKLLCPRSKCAYINTFISTHCLHAAMNVNRKNFSLQSRTQ